MGNIIKLILALLAFPAAYFIFQVGDAALSKANLGYGTPAYTLMLLTVLAPILLGLMMVLALMKSKLIKHIPPLLLLTGVAIVWLKVSL